MFLSAECKRWDSHPCIATNRFGRLSSSSTFGGGIMRLAWLISCLSFAQVLRDDVKNMLLGWG